MDVQAELAHRKGPDDGGSRAESESWEASGKSLNLSQTQFVHLKKEWDLITSESLFSTKVSMAGQKNSEILRRINEESNGPPPRVTELFRSAGLCA